MDVFVPRSAAATRREKARLKKEMQARALARNLRQQAADLEALGFPLVAQRCRDAAENVEAENNVR